ncbi:MAG: hypothetical protein M3512_08060 [Bacteroidota bacterium]|nr:hypothetical protein [Bacteroidota bacterium]
MRLKFLISFYVAFFFSFFTIAQTYVGISANFGNQLKYSPASEGFKTPVAISGNLVLSVQETHTTGWAVQYGLSAGILGYNLKVDSNVFREYADFYGRFHLLFGKEFLLKKKKWMLSLGGGATYYYNLYPTTSYGGSIIDEDQNVREIFYAQVNSPVNKIVPFAKISAQCKMTDSIILGLEYSYHFKPLLNGFYEFYDTETPTNGKITLYQRELNFVFMVKIPRIKP